MPLYHLASASVDYARLSLQNLRADMDIQAGFPRNIFHPIELCARIKREQREVSFGYVSVSGVTIQSPSGLREMQKRGVRPALFEEAIALARCWREQRLEVKERERDGQNDVAGRYVVLGSCAEVKRSRRSEAPLMTPYLAMLDLADRSTLLFQHDVGTCWSTRTRFLCVFESLASDFYLQCNVECRPTRRRS